MADSDRYCEDCNTSFNTLTKLRLHDCDDHRDLEPDLDPDWESDRQGTYSFEGEVETWHGTVDGKASGTISEDVQGCDCALCGDDAVQTVQMWMDWEPVLREEHDDYLPVTGGQRIPVCPPCSLRLSSLREAEKEMGYMDDDVQEELKTARQQTLREINPDAIITPAEW